MISKSAVVTGGAGFIGSHLVDGLLERGYRVTIIDDLSTGKLENLSRVLNPTNPTTQQTQGTKGTQHTHFSEGSIIDLPLLKDVFRGIDYVFHQAAIPSVPRSVQNPSVTHEANVTGTLNVLLAAKESGVKKVVYASSSSAYGDTPTLPKREDMPPCPLSPYAVSKLAGEYYCNVFQLVYGLPTICLRYFNVYGPRQDPESQYAAVIPRFVTGALEGRPFTIYGDGLQTRDFTYISDVVEANILAAEGDACGVCNIGRGERVTINELAGLVIKLVGSDVRPVYSEPRPADILHSLADVSRARQFGYNPVYSLEEGLRETIRVMRDG